MTAENIVIESNLPQIVRFRPVLKRLIWGGRKLGDLLGKPLGPEPDYAESWEVVDHGEDQSRVADGPLAGKTLHELVTDHAQWLLGTNRHLASFPLLVKYLDCQRALSVQVHPNDEYALRMPKPDRGKTEAWYIIDAAPESLVYAGLKQGVGRAEFEQAIRTGTTEHCLHSFHPEPGDCLFIPAGTVHALGAGLLVAEIQQSSDTTFRIFDWNRVDASGKSRELHVQQSLDVIDFDSGPVSPIKRAGSIGRWQRLVECEYFEFSSLEGGRSVDAAGDTGTRDNLARDTVGGDGDCHLLTVVKGAANLKLRSGNETLGLGETVLVPAASGNLECQVNSGSCLLAMRAR